ncbi:MAG: zf-HC2 domain-containing protein [Gemmatirosa sp.]|nr:zf-HC2 domain-containing protein [Gemmatirosa sp.]
MTDQQGGAWRWVDPAQEAVRQARHEVLIDLLGAYVDEELPPETASQLDAHLVGCARCRREVQVQLTLRDRLAATPVEPVRPALRDRIVAMTTALPAPPAVPAAVDAARRDEHLGAALDERRRRLPWIRALLVAIVLVAVPAWAFLRVRPDSPAVARLAAPTGGVPLLAAAAADYRRIAAADLPGPARDLDAVQTAVGFPVSPLSNPALRLIGAWTTTLAGEPAAVLAYRWDDRLIVQYIVPDQLFFRHPAMRSAAATHHAVALADGAVGIVAWPLASAGSVLVGDGSPERLAGALVR